MESRRNQPELVAYDVDGTMIDDIPGQTTGVAFWKLLDKELLNPGPDVLQELENLNQLMAEGGETDEWLNTEYSKLIVRSFDSNIAGLRKGDIIRVFEEHADYIASEKIYPEMLEEINYWKDRQAAQVLISGSPDPFIQALKRRLGLYCATGTRIFYQQGRVHPERTPSTRGIDKHLIAEKFRCKLGETAIFRSSYGDTMNDLSMMKDSEIPVAVNPKSDLRQIALEHDWRIIDTVKHEARLAS